jgi:hypothetical protein
MNLLVNWQEFPVFYPGAIDKGGHYHPYVMVILLKETSAEYKLLVNIVDFVQRLY